MELVAGLLAAAGGWCGDTGTGSVHLVLRFQDGAGGGAGGCWCGDTGTGSVHLLLGAGHRWTLLCWRNESAGNTEAGGNYGTDAGTLTT